MRNRFTISTLCALLCAGAISACGGSSGGGSDNGVSSKSASDIGQLPARLRVGLQR
jgi:hypothetical protein